MKTLLISILLCLIYNQSNCQDRYTGDWKGKDLCTMGSGSMKWSNPYSIKIFETDGILYLKGLFHQRNEVLELKVQPTNLQIESQNFMNDEYKILGATQFNDSLLTFNYGILMPNSNGGIDTNFCQSVFEPKEWGVESFDINANDKTTIWLPKNQNWCLFEIKGGNRIWLEGYLPNKGYGKYDIYVNQLPVYLGDENKFTVTPFDDIRLIFKLCEKK